jgi:hypothetical protein
MNNSSQHQETVASIHHYHHSSNNNTTTTSQTRSNFSPLWCICPRSRWGPCSHRRPFNGHRGCQRSNGQAWWVAFPSLRPYRGATSGLLKHRVTALWGRERSCYGIGWQRRGQWRLGTKKDGNGRKNPSPISVTTFYHWKRDRFRKRVGTVT